MNKRVGLAVSIRVFDGSFSVCLGKVVNELSNNEILSV